MTTEPILAYDTSCAGASIALSIAGIVHSRRIEPPDQVTDLVPGVDALLREHAVAYSDLACMVTTIGPGSFTGLRIGLAALHGFALVAQTPVKLLSSLHTLAWQVATMADAPQQFHIALRAGKGEVYAQRFRLAQIESAAPIIPQADGDIFLAPETANMVSPISLPGNEIRGNFNLAAPCFGNHIDSTSPYFIAAPDAAIICVISHLLPAARLADAMPLYIRPPDAIAAAPHPWLRTKS